MLPTDAEKENFYQKIKQATTPLQGSQPHSFTFSKSVKLKDEGKTILDFYAEAFPHKTRQEWKNRIDSGKIKVNDSCVSSDKILKKSWITKHQLDNIVEPNVNTNIKLIYQNESILVLNKPAPLPVHPSGRFIKNTLTGILKQAFSNQEYKIVHRLDANTTGILVLAKNKETANILMQKFKNQEIKKTYIALVEGNLDAKINEITAAIGVEKQVSGARKLSSNGQQARTQVQILDKRANQTLVKLEPKSGKTNQLRLHLASINHPIIGDYGYKNPDYFKSNPMTYQEDCLMLHAYKLTFALRGKTYNFVADLPAKFKNLY